MKNLNETGGPKFDVVIFDLPDAVKETAWLYSQDIFRLAKSVMNPDGMFSTHSGGNVCINHREEANGYPGEPCMFLPRLHSTLESVWKHASIALSPMPLWQDFHGFQYATDTALPPHALAGYDIDQRLRERLTMKGKESHPNLAGRLQYYSGMAHMNMHKVELTYWNWMKGVTDVLTPAAIKKFFKSSGTSYEGLSEMKVCHCDPHQCIFHNGMKGPLRKASDVYEVEDEIYGESLTGEEAAARIIQVQALEKAQAAARKQDEL